jgi:uncharacterized protein (TIGR02147 family)
LRRVACAVEVKLSVYNFDSRSFFGHDQVIEFQCLSKEQEMRDLTIFDYKDPVLFLQAYFEKLKKHDPSFTIRRWSKRMGYSSPVVLFAIMNRKRAIKIRDLSSIFAGLELNPNESLYLRVLIMLAQADTREEKEILEIALEQLSPQAARPVGAPSNVERKGTIHETEHDELFSHWTDAAVLSMLRLQEARQDIRVIRDNLLWESDPSQVERSYQKICRLGLLEKDSEGQSRPKYDDVVTKSDQKHVGARAYFSQVNEIAIRAIELPLAEREFQCFSLVIRKSDIAKFKQMIRDYRADISNQEAENGDTVYQFNFEMFPLSKPLSHIVKLDESSERDVLN